MIACNACALKKPKNCTHMIAMVALLCLKYIKSILMSCLDRFSTRSLTLVFQITIIRGTAINQVNLKQIETKYIESNFLL